MMSSIGLLVLSGTDSTTDQGVMRPKRLLYHCEEFCGGCYFTTKSKTLTAEPVPNADPIDFYSGLLVTVGTPA